MTDPNDENVVECPVCGEKTRVDEEEAKKKGYVLCPKGHKVELMHGLM
jgi:hypothetical protein